MTRKYKLTGRWTDTPARQAARKRSHLIFRLRGVYCFLQHINYELDLRTEEANIEIDKLLFKLGAEPEAERQPRERKEFEDEMEALHG